MESLSYQNVCTAYGILKIARATGDDELRKRIEAKFRPYLLEGTDPKRDNAKVPQHQWFGFVPLELYRQTQVREKGDSPHLCAAPSGPFRQMGTVPFFPERARQMPQGSSRWK
jgi:hypothetical protein